MKCSEIQKGDLIRCPLMKSIHEVVEVRDIGARVHVLCEGDVQFYLAKESTVTAFRVLVFDE